MQEASIHSLEGGLGVGEGVVQAELAGSHLIARHFELVNSEVALAVDVGALQGEGSVLAAVELGAATEGDIVVSLGLHVDIVAELEALAQQVCQVEVGKDPGEPGGKSKHCNTHR